MGAATQRPQLFGGFSFSPAMENAKLTSDQASLDKFLQNPAEFMPGTRMFFNLPKPTDRQNVIAYLAEQR